MASLASAAPADLEKVLEEQRQHGFSAPALAIKQLTAAGAGIASAPLELRMRYHAALASLYIGSEQPALLKAELAELERMAAAEQCQPCAHYKLVRETQLANRMQDVTGSRNLLAKLDMLTFAEPNLRQAIHFVRAGALEAGGNQARAIDDAIQATQLAIATNNPAEHVRSLNMLMLANIGRRDLSRAEALAEEAYALAERIGFVYMMALDQQEAMQASRSRDRSYKACVGLMLLDVDHFKHINDTYSHAAGDMVLVEIARRLQALVRQHDVVVRWGGEEFVLVLPGTASDGMAVLAERTLRAIGDAPVMVEGRAVLVTVSLGCACYPLLPGLPWQDSLKVADLAMYHAKQHGRNRAVCVMSVDGAAPATLVLTDLAAAHAAGQVTLQTIEGASMMVQI